MPIFEYVCQECNHRFEVLVQGKKIPVCPSCESPKLQKKFSAFAVGISRADLPVCESTGTCPGRCARKEACALQA